MEKIKEKTLKEIAKEIFDGFKEVSKKLKTTEIVFLDGSRGVNLPKTFIEIFPELQEFYPELKDPYNDHYWDAWEELIEDLNNVLEKYNIYFYQDEDLFLCRY